MQPKILLFDLEVSRDIVAGYGNKYDFKVVKTIRHQELMCFAYKWLGDKKVSYISRHDVASQSYLVEHLRDILDEADIVIAHNGAKFDVRMANRFFVQQGLTPPSPYKVIDTLQIARRNFKFQSNSLNDLAAFLDLGKKESITYADLEDDFMSDNPSRKTLRLMEKYNKQDIILLEKIYQKLRPFMRNHPNVGDITQTDHVCPQCGGKNLEKRGFIFLRNGKKQRYQCKDDGSWSTEAKLRQEGRIVSA